MSIDSLSIQSSIHSRDNSLSSEGASDVRSGGDLLADDGTDTTPTRTATGSDLDGEWDQLVLHTSEAEEYFGDGPGPQLILKRTRSGTLLNFPCESVYGSPLSVEEAEARLPPGGGGMVWDVLIIPDTFVVDGKLQKGLNQADFDCEKMMIKPRRPSLPVTETEFFSSLTRAGNRHIFYGILNGWPSLRCLELVALEQRRHHEGALPSPFDLIRGPALWKRIWSADVEGAQGIKPQLLDKRRFYRAKLRGAPWTALGWAKESPGFVFWYEAQRPQEPRLSYGSSILHTVGEEQCTRVHMISHRYAVVRESARDRLTYHSIVLLEWDHGRFGTVVEMAFLNGMGGYKGKSNWYDDKDDTMTGLYQSLPPEMISPWLSRSAEIRCYDVQQRTLDDMKVYMAKYVGPTQRFVDPHFSFSHAARLTFRTKRHIAQYLWNYITRDSSYAELKRNCQTFAADLCALLAGKKDVPPFHPVNRIDYQNRVHFFLYDGLLYQRKKGKSWP